MAKKAPVLIHPLTVMDAINEHHTRVGMLLAAVQVTIQLGNLPGPVKEKLQEAMDRVHEVYGQ